MANKIENQKFIEAIIVSYPLDDGIIWIQDNLNPEDVFKKDQLERWADNSGYIKE